MSFVDELTKRGWEMPRAVGTISAPELDGRLTAQYYAIPTPSAPIHKKLGALVVGTDLIRDVPVAQEVAAEAMIDFLDSLGSA